MFLLQEIILQLSPTWNILNLFFTSSLNRRTLAPEGSWRHCRPSNLVSLFKAVLPTDYFPLIDDFLAKDYDQLPGQIIWCNGYEQELVIEETPVLGLIFSHILFVFKNSVSVYAYRLRHLLCVGTSTASLKIDYFANKWLFISIW